MLSVTMLSVTMLSVTMLSVTMLSVIMPTVVAPKEGQSSERNKNKNRPILVVGRCHDTLPNDT
jgi:hypothetical protein